MWIVTSWKGRFPFEKNNDRVYVYDVKGDKWSTKTGLPERRRRGGAAAVRKGDIIYVVAGNRGGHGAHATSLRWVDGYNWRKNTWFTMPDMPQGSERDHVGGALVNGMICVAGGHDGGSRNFFNANVESTYCLDFTMKKWVRKENFPAPRAGANTERTCSGGMMIAGGEGDGVAYKRVDVFDGKKWRREADMVRQRHSSGMAVSRCECGHIFVASGSGSQGGSPELTTTEEFVPAGKPDRCSTY